MSTADLDRQDVTLAAGGDHAAFERLYRRHVGRVNGLARWLLDPGDAEDAVQEVFIRVWRKLHTFAGQSAFGTWLHRVAVNLFLRRRQSGSQDRKRQISDEVAMLSAPGVAERPDLKVALERAVDKLPAGAREVFVLHDMEGTSTRKSPGCWRSIPVPPGPSSIGPGCCSGSIWPIETEAEHA